MKVRSLPGRCSSAVLMVLRLQSLPLMRAPSTMNMAATYAPPAWLCWPRPPLSAAVRYWLGSIVVRTSGPLTPAESPVLAVA